MKLPKLNHAAKDLSDVFGLTPRENVITKSAIIFQTISSRLMAQELFEPDERPMDLVTRSGVLEKTLDLLEKEEMKIYALLVFNEVYSKVVNDLHEMTEESKRLDEKKEGPKNIKDLFKMMARHMEYASTALAFKAVKECNHDFDAFVEKMIPEDIEEKIADMKDSVESGDLGDLLKGLGINFGMGEDGGNDEEEDEDDRWKF